MVFFLEDAQQLPLAAMLPLVPQGRREKALALRAPADRCSSLAAYLLLRFALLTRCGVDARPELAADARGKPCLPWPGLFVSLSHSKGAALCALETSEIGADVERCGRCRPSVLRRAFSPQEQRAVERAQEPGRVFTEIWTRKEAYGKALGLGVCYPMAQVELSGAGSCGAWQLTSWAQGDYLLSACCRQAQELQCVSPQTLLRTLTEKE